METLFVKNYLEEFSGNIKNIISELDSQCVCNNDYHSVLMLINKLYFYTQNFFIDNEIAKKDKSSELNFVKQQSEKFSYILIKFQHKFEAGDEKALCKMKEFLKNWIKKPYISESPQFSCN